MSHHTKSQTEALKEIEGHLTLAFEKSQKRMRRPWRMRTWMHPYFKTMIRLYYKARTTHVDGVRLTALIGTRKTEIFAALIKATTNRDRKTRSRWAGMLANAANADVTPADLVSWLKRGGGIAGRSRGPNRPTARTGVPAPRAPALRRPKLPFRPAKKNIGDVKQDWDVDR